MSFYSGNSADCKILALTVNLSSFSWIFKSRQVRLYRHYLFHLCGYEGFFLSAPPLFQASIFGIIIHSWILNIRLMKNSWKVIEIAVHHFRICLWGECSDKQSWYYFSCALISLFGDIESGDWQVLLVLTFIRATNIQNNSILQHCMRKKVLRPLEGRRPESWIPNL